MADQRGSTAALFGLLSTEEVKMPAESLMFDDASVMTESGEDAFRRIVVRKLRERGCQEAEIESSVERLLAKQVGLEFSEIIGK